QQHGACRAAFDHALKGIDLMNKTTWWKRTALWAAGLACAAGALAGCTTSRDQYSQSSNISAYGVVDVGIDRTSR
ncbi:hypothetical protein PVV23_25825, partial [Salmonella enterica subsp. enterica serovar Typhimurium]